MVTKRKSEKRFEQLRWMREELFPQLALALESVLHDAVREQLEKEAKGLLQEEDPEQDREMTAIDGAAPTTLPSA
mgnify:CR=1 FL=1